jgi:hypothetical protein
MPDEPARYFDKIALLFYCFTSDLSGCRPQSKAGSRLNGTI